MKVEPIIQILVGLLVFMIGALFLANWMFPSDGQFYQGLSGIAQGVFGLLAGILVPRKTSSEVPSTPGSSQRTTTLTEETVKAP